MTPLPAFRFAHLADVHLGAVRFDVPALADDCRRAFERALTRAREEGADFAVVAGDLFHRALVPPEVLAAAERTLETAGTMPVIAIDGNHDATLYSRRASYVWYLGQRARLRFLRPFFDAREQRYEAVPWTPERGEGFYCEPLPGVRVYGLGYGGATAGVKIARMAAAMEPGHRATLALLHGAIDRLVGAGLGEVRYQELEPLRGIVDYLACGHIHRRYEDDFAHNPGSLENIYLDEAERDARGFYLVDVEGHRYTTRLIEVPGRPVYRPEPFRAEGMASEDELREAFCAWVERLACEEDAIVAVRLSGSVPFNFALLDLSELEAMVRARLSPAHVVISNDLNLAGAERAHGFMDRGAIEQEVLREALEEELPEHRERFEELLELVFAIRRKDPRPRDKAGLQEVLEMARAYVERGEIEASSSEPPGDPCA